MLIIMAEEKIEKGVISEEALEEIAGGLNISKDTLQEKRKSHKRFQREKEILSRTCYQHSRLWTLIPTFYIQYNGNSAQSEE